MENAENSNTRKRDAEDLKFVVMNSLTHILEDIETHRNSTTSYGNQFI